MKYLSLRAEQPDKDVALVTVLYPGKGTLTVNGDKRKFAQTSAGWIPTKVSGEKVPKPEAPEDRTLKPAQR